MIFKPENKKISLDISLLGSSIEIISEERENIELVSEKLTNAAINELFKINYEDGILSIKENKKVSFSFLKVEITKHADRKLQVKIPNEFKKTTILKQKGGNIEFLNDYIGDVELKVMGGNVIANDLIEGNCSVKLLGGNIDLMNLKSHFKGKVLGGNLDIKDSVLKSIDLKIIGGNADIRGIVEITKKGKISIIGGSLDFQIDNYNSDESISIKRIGGDVDLKGDYPDDKISFNRHRKLNHKHCKNFDLDISGLDNIGETIANALTGIKDMFNSENIKTEPDNAKGSRNEEISKILKMLEDGKISAEQAEKLISAINKE